MSNANQAKQELGIPDLVKRALMEDGWICRQTIIWHKPNPMPESVKDRCTKAHEYVFLFSKSQKYYFDSDSISEPLAYPKETRRPIGSNGAWEIDGRKRGENGGGKPYEGYPERRNKRSVWSVVTRPFKGAHFATFPQKLIEPMILAGCPKGGVVLDTFSGVGTTQLVSEQNGRNSIYIDLKQEYADMARERIYEATKQMKMC